MTAHRKAGPGWKISYQGPNKKARAVSQYGSFVMAFIIIGKQGFCQIEGSIPSFSKRAFSNVNGTLFQMSGLPPVLAKGKEPGRTPAPFAARNSGVFAPVLSAPEGPAAFQRKTSWESTTPEPAPPATGQPGKNQPGHRKKRPPPEWLQASLKSAIRLPERATANTVRRRSKGEAASTPKANRYIWAAP